VPPTRPTLRRFITPAPDFPTRSDGSVDIVESVRSVVRVESYALVQLQNQIDRQHAAITAVCTLIKERCQEDLPGRLIVTGIGKAGKIADKLSATFASTGTPSCFLHPAEARHGDLGMVGRHDVVLALSFSGSSEEVLSLLPHLRRIGPPVIALVGREDSPLARHADHVLWVGNVIEACPLGMAPSASTTAMLALGDAVALTVQQMRGFSAAQYARYHPGGALGRKLMTCAEVMRRGDRLPAVAAGTTVIDGLKTITKVRAGLVMVVDADGRATGLFTDGDMRRLLAGADDPRAVLSEPIERHAHPRFASIGPDDLVETALHRCAERRINALPVLDEGGHLVGLIDLQDLVDRGFDAGAELPGL
jgi:arabinose-5-phosphate isomerase